MAIQRNIQKAYGYPNPQAEMPPYPIAANRNPTAADQGQVGQIWCNETADTTFILTSVKSGVATWSTSPSGLVTSLALTVSPGDLIVDTGDASVAGTLTITGATTLAALAATNVIFSGTLQVGGNTTLNGDLTVTGDFAVTGDFDITDTASVGITSTNNAAGAITLLTNGGINETLLAQSSQGTGAGSITLNSVAGGILIGSCAKSSGSRV